jgi:hypothetical protein
MLTGTEVRSEDKKVSYRNKLTIYRVMRHYYVDDLFYIYVVFEQRLKQSLAKILSAT